MKNYWLVRLGKANKYAKECLKDGFIGVDFVGDIDLTNQLTEDWREFNHKMIPIWLKLNPDKTKIAAGLACGSLWSTAKGIQIGDIVLSPIEKSHKFAVGEISGNYRFQKGGHLPHQRPINWLKIIDKHSISQKLNYALTLNYSTAYSLNKYADELEKIINHNEVVISTNDETIEDPTTFATEKHLEEFLVKNWEHTELGKKYDIYKTEEGTGEQYPTDTGAIDILAISKDKKELLVIELKKGRASDAVAGQIARYMSYVKDELAEKNQTVKGLIISFEDDHRLRRALKIIPNVDLIFYEVHFKLKKNNGSF